MKKFLAFLCLASTFPTYAGIISGYAKISSNYIWRGLTFSENEPVVALSANYEHETGFYGNLFGSSLKFAEPTLYEGFSKRELDLTAGYKRSIGDWTGNIFVNRYEFIDQPKISAFEYSVHLTYKSTTLEYNLLPDWFGYNSRSHYTRLTQGYALDEKFNLIGGVGYNSQSRTSRIQDNDGDWKGVGFTNYMDYFLGLQIKEANGFLYEFIYTDTNRKTISYASTNPADDGKKADANDQAFTVSLTKSF